MYLALLGFGMIVVFMALIMAKKLSPFTSLILIPILFGLLAGYGWDTLSYAMDGIKDVASTFAMMTFAILYFGIMLTAGMFDPMVDKVVSWCKGDPLKVLVGTAVLAAFVSLDGDGTTTVMICCTAMLPIYERLHIKKIYLATLIILQNCIMNLIPWGGPGSSGPRHGTGRSLLGRRQLLSGPERAQAPGRHQVRGEYCVQGGAL